MPLRSLYSALLLVLTCLLLAGCPSKEAGDVVEDPEVYFQEPVPPGEPQYAQIDKPYFSYIPNPDDAAEAEIELDDPGLNYKLRDGALSLVSYDPYSPLNDDESQGPLNPQTVVSSETSLLINLNTQTDNGDAADYSAFVSNDVVYSLNHDSGEIRALRQFRNRVCAVIPVDTLDISGVAGGDQAYQMLHANTLYVETSEGLCEGDDSGFEQATRRYYRLALNYQYNASLAELCTDETLDGESGRNTNEDSCKSRDFAPVLESEARAKLVLGWVDDDQTSNSSDHKLGWGYLGYGTREASLRFYNAARELVWSQDRNVEHFDIVSLEQGFSEEVLFELTQLNGPEPLPASTDYRAVHYAMQIGRDVFFFNSNDALFDIAFNDRLTAFSDRAYQLDVSEVDGKNYIRKAEFLSDDDEVLFVDQFKLYRKFYEVGVFSPVTTREFSLRDHALEITPRDYAQTSNFSQFDLADCDGEGSTAAISACENAHDVEDRQLPAPGPAWEFVTSCQAALGCVIAEDFTDYCVTDAELIADPSLADENRPCTPSQYLHLNELDGSANDAEFRGFLQYASDYARELRYQLYSDSLLITARMKERDILLRYYYQEPLSAPRTDRQEVLLGSRFAHQGVQAFVDDGDLYVNVLRFSATRNNECYKNFQEVECLLGDLVNDGTVTQCTGKDLAAGLCFDHFDEYKSYALFCSEAELAAGLCVDSTCPLAGACPGETAPIYSLLVDYAQAPQSKWFPFYRLDGSGILEQEIKLLAGQDADDDPSLDNDAYVRDEGVLVSPRLWNFDAATESLSGGSEIAILNTAVETVIPATVLEDNAVFEVISSDIVQGSFDLISELSQLSLLDLDTPSQEVEAISNLQVDRPPLKRN